ncbi:RNA 3'-terminal phosphate cyclase, partial [Salmonella enterica]|uniref:RNA 3'-terminal phosphate cyclase n=1 Tax=Salmonella enterica TaxID=28901 RepID=UPI002666FD42
GIRAGGAKRGLLGLILPAGGAAREFCGAMVKGDVLGSQLLLFTRGPIRGGVYGFAFGSGGFCLLVLKTVLPAIPIAK